MQGGFTLDVANLDLTATVADNDYEPNSDTLTFVGDANERHTFTIYVNGDKKVEADEAFGAQITAGPVTPLASDIMVTTEVGRFDLDFHTAKIFNDDSAKVTLTGAEVVTEGDSGNTFVKYTATLDNPVAGGFKIPFSTLSGSASNTSDFVDNDQTLTFNGNAGESKSVTVRVLGDELVEADETFYVSLGDFTNTSFGGDLSVSGSPKVVTIENDDQAKVTLSGGTAKVEGDSGKVAFTFDATLDADVDGGFTVAYSTDDGTATAADNDYQDNDGTLYFGGTNGETRTITVEVVGDTVGEAHEYFLVNLGSVLPDKSGISIDTSGSPQKGTITNDDEGVLFLDIGDGEIDEGAGTLEVEVALSNVKGASVTVDYVVSAGTATAGDDFTASSGTLSFAAGELTKVIQIPIVDDNVAEAAETISIALSNPSGVIFGNPDSAHVTIIDNEPAPKVAFNGSTISLSESAGNAVVELTLSGPSQAPITVEFAAAGDSAKAGEDFEAILQKVIFAPGETTATATIQILPDNIYERDETLLVSLNNVKNGELGAVVNAAVTIEEDDPVPSIIVSDVTVIEQDSGEQVMNFEVQLSALAGRRSYC